ncbi:EamA family transporter [Hymenobacter sp. 15J16-1T3B]|uniref:EamA family transporter n=1 Tax=Hymenobacter sp. 15J16-1T3B TaxID=2886941 RepID=UPI001D10D20F|nr:EamA family transporter [Hymenobacter sp. 15J16-1T3B]MCC3160803.1 EamA family transporter [Hymenobacter sp. 15J16-1T3B]
MWMVFSLLAALSAAIVVTLSKIGLKNVDPVLAFAVQAVLILLVSWGVVTWQGKLPDVSSIPRRDLLFLVAAGVVTCLSSLCSFQALKLGAASRAGVLDKVSLVFVVILAVVFLKEKLNWQLVLGALLMVGGAVLIALSQKAANN